jgi:uncharacterized protein YqiB (DUF1249 family)
MSLSVHWNLPTWQVILCLVTYGHLRVLLPSLTTTCPTLCTFPFVHRVHSFNLNIIRVSNIDTSSKISHRDMTGVTIVLCPVSYYSDPYATVKIYRFLS